MKGISPLIAGVLLIALTVTIAAIVTTWASGFTSVTQSGIGNKSIELVGCSGAALEVEAVYLTEGGAASNATAIVKNTGLVNNMQITAAELLVTNGTNTTAGSLPVTNVDRGNIITLSFNNFDLGGACPGTFSKITIQSACPGGAITFDVQYEAPNCA